MARFFWILTLFFVITHMTKADAYDQMSNEQWDPNEPNGYTTVTVPSGSQGYRGGYNSNPPPFFRENKCYQCDPLQNPSTCQQGGCGNNPLDAAVSMQLSNSTIRLLGEKTQQNKKDKALAKKPKPVIIKKIKRPNNIPGTKNRPRAPSFKK